MNTDKGTQVKKHTGVLLRWCFGLTVAVIFMIYLSMAFAQVTITYTYDELDRLETVVRSDGPATDYVMDVVSNVTVATISESPDTDGDQQADFADLDDDNDGMSDLYEMQYGLNPLDPSDASLDPDGDGRNNLQEFMDSTNPLVADEPTSEVNVPILPLWALGLLAAILLAVFKLKARTHHIASLAVIGLALTYFSMDAAQAELDPGWHSFGDVEAVAPEEARDILGIDVDAQLQAHGITSSSSAFSVSSLISAPDEFDQIAEALENDPLKIYLFVKNNIDYVPYYGALKGPHLTYIERAGNDFDQAALLVELLRAAGYSANYRIGDMFMPINVASDYDLANWLGVTPSSSVIRTVLANGGVPNSASGSNVFLGRAWVQVVVGSTTHQLDPAFKRYETTAGIDLAAAMNYSQSGLLSAMGGTTGTNYVQNLNQAGLGSELLRLSNDLTATIKGNHANATTDEIIGGRKIIPETITVLPQSIPFTTISNLFTSIPDSYVHKVEIIQGGLNTTLDIPQVAGKKLSLVYADTPSGTLSLLASSAAQVPEIDSDAVIVNEASSEPIVIENVITTPPPGVSLSADGAFALSDLTITDQDGEVVQSGVAAAAAGIPVNWGTLQQGQLPANWAFVPPYTNPNTIVDILVQTSLTGNSAYQLTQGAGPVTLDTGQTWSMNMRLNPTSRGTKTGTFSVGRSCVPALCQPSSETYNMTAVIAETPSLSGSGRNFSAQLGSPLNSTVFLQNLGSVSLTITNVALINNSSGQFSLTSGTGSGTVASGGRRTIGVRYAASSRGSHSASVRVSYDYDGLTGYTFDLPVSGVTGLAPDIGGSAGADFGSTQLNVTVDREVVLRNSGTLPLTITGTSLTSSRFQLISGTGNITLSPGSERRTTVRYRANAIGTHVGDVRVTFNYDGRTGFQLDLPLQGQTSDVKYAQLYLDDVLIAEETTTPTDPDAVSQLHVNVDHPYAAQGGEFADQEAIYNIKRTGTYVLVSGFGTDQRSELLTRAQRKLDMLRASGLADTSNDVLTASLNVMGQTWMQQTALNADLLAKMADAIPIQHHRFGLVGQEEGYFIDVKNQVISVLGRDGSQSTDYFRARSFMASALENGVLEQLQQGRVAASTIKVLKLANQQGYRIYDATDSNWASIEPLLTDYSTGDLDRFEDAVNNDNARFILPANGLIRLNQWEGKGYVDYRENATNLRDSLGMIIGGDYFGGFGGTRSPLNVDWLNAESYLEWQPRSNISTPTAADPVDMGTGAMVSTTTDIALGLSGSRGLAFTRMYNSQQTSQDTMHLGKGWTASYYGSISYHSNVEAGMGRRAPLDAVAMLVVSHVALDLMADEQPTLRQWMAAALAADWAMDELLDNAVTITIGSDVMTFIQFPNGEYCPPEGVSVTLQESGGNFQAVERFGTTYAFNSNDRISSITDIDGNALNFSYVNDSSGYRLTQVQDAFGRTLTLNYSTASGSLRLTGVSDSTGRSVSYTHVNDELRTFTGLENAVWQYTYDALGQLLTVTDPESTVIVDNTYDALGRVVQQIAPRQLGTATYKMGYTGLSSVEEAPDLSRTTYFFDDNKRTVAAEDGMGYINKTEYDGQGHAVNFTDARGNTSSLRYGNNQEVLESTDALNNSATYQYDSQFRMTHATDANDNTTETDFDSEHHPIAERDALNHEFTSTYRPDGLLATRTNARNITTTYTYDSNGYPDTTQTGTQPPITTVYDARGNMTSLTDQAGATTSFIYDDRGLVTERTDSHNKKTSYIYDNLGRVTSETDRNNHTSTVTYTPTSNIDTITYPAKSGTSTHFPVPGFTVQYGYDEKDQLITMTDQHGTTNNYYDAVGRLTRHTDPNSHEVQYDYDGVNNVTEITYPDGKTVSYTYDPLNRVDSISIDWLGKTATPAYDDAGRLMSISHFNGTSTTYQYDDADRLTNLTHYKGNNTAFTDYQYVLDPNGNRTETTITNEAIKPAALVNGVDAKTYNTQKNRLVSANLDDVLSFDYDDEGQLETYHGSITSTAHGFDAAGRVVYHGTADTYVEYTYDGAGNRLTATRDGDTTQYIHDQNGNLLAEANASGNITRYYIYGLGLMAYVDAQTNKLYVYHHDGTGHTIAVTDGNQDITHRYAYSPFGKLMAKEEAHEQPFTYAGQAGIYTEAEGLYYMRARYYDANLGQFISEDPAGFAGGINLYAYAGGNPIKYIDPTGLSPESGGVGSALLDFGLGFIPGYDLYRTIQNPDATWVDYGTSALGVFPGAGKVASIVAKGATKLGRKAIPTPPTGKGSVPPSQRDPKRVLTKTEKTDLLNKRGGNCEGCGKPIGPDDARAHHIQRHADGGPTNAENTAILCDPCHRDIHRRRRR